MFGRPQTVKKMTMKLPSAELMEVAIVSHWTNAALGGAGGKIARWLAVFGETGAPIQVRQLTATLVAMPG
jgi:hypothetical protein